MKKQHPGQQTSQQTACKQCGTCCIKGGPSFHLEDKHLIDKGIIQAKYLYTIRQGEMAYDNITEKQCHAETDIIKIKGKNNAWTCYFLNNTDNTCGIYDNRPLECKTLKCWDTSAIINMYSQNRLTRKDLLSNIDGLWRLIEEHQASCAYPALDRLIETFKGNAETKAEQHIIQMVNLDYQFRQLVNEQNDMDPELLDFLFGRPLGVTIKMFGVKLIKDTTRYRLLKT